MKTRLAGSGLVCGLALLLVGSANADPFPRDESETNLVEVPVATPRGTGAFRLGYVCFGGRCEAEGVFVAPRGGASLVFREVSDAPPRVEARGGRVLLRLSYLPIGAAEPTTVLRAYLWNERTHTLELACHHGGD